MLSLVFSAFVLMAMFWLPPLLKQRRTRAALVRNAKLGALVLAGFFCACSNTGNKSSNSKEVASSSAPLCTGTALAISPGRQLPLNAVATLTASAACNSADAPQFAFFYRRVGASSWSSIRDWDAPPTTSWNTSSLGQGSYELKVDVKRNAGSTIADASGFATIVVGGVDDSCRNLGLGTGPTADSTDAATFFSQTVWPGGTIGETTILDKDVQGRGARAKGQALVLSVSDVEYNRQDVIGAHYRSVIDAINSLPAGTHTLTVELDYATNDDDDYPWMESHHFSSHYLLNFYGTLVDDSGGDGVLVGGRTALKETGTIHNFAHHAKTFTFKIVEANAPKPRPEGTFERGKFRGFKAGVIVNNKLDAAVLEASILVVDNLAMRLNGGPLIYRNTFDASGPDADADGVIDACQACDDRVDSDGDQINDCSEQRDGSEWTDPLVFNGPMVERGIAGTLPACSALTEPALDQYLAANAPTQRQHMASGWSNWGTYQTNSCGASYDFSPQWSSCPSPWYAHYNAEFSVEDPGYHCFSISQNHSCAALYVDGTAISANQARRCFHRQSGVLPIRWFTQPSSGFYQTNAVRNLTLNVRYCYGQDAECEPVSVLPQSLLRSGESTCMAALVGRANADYTATALKVINRQFTPAQSLALSRDRKRRMRAARADVSLAARLCDRSDVDGDWVIDSEDQCPGTPDLIATDDRGCPLATLPRAPSAEMVAGLLDETQITFNPNCTTAPVPNTVSAGLFHRITSNAHRGAYVFAGRVTNQPSGCPVWYHFEIDESGRVNRRYLASFKDTEELSAAFGNGSPVPRGLIQFRTGSGDTGTRAWLAEPKHGVTTRVRVRAMNANGARGPWSDWRSTTCNDCLRMGLACTWLCEQELITATGDVTVAR